MRVDSLPSPGQLSMGIALQRVMSKAISSVEISASFGGGKASSAKQLDVFLDACKTAISTFIDVTVPTVLARYVPSAQANKVYIQASEALDPKFVPLPGVFAIAGVAKTVSKVEIDGPFVILTVTVPFVNGNVSTVAYTQSGVNNLRDLSGNLLANFTAAAIVNNVA